MRELCPKGAIELRESVITDPALCIHCCACVKICPNDARVMEDEKMSQIIEWLYKKRSARKEPEFFLLISPSRNSSFWTGFINDV